RPLIPVALPARPCGAARLRPGPTRRAAPAASRTCQLRSDRATLARGLLIGDALDQLVEGLGEEPDPVDLELPSDRLQVDAQLAQLAPDAARLVDVGVERPRDPAVIAERRQRLRRHR